MRLSHFLFVTSTTRSSSGLGIFVPLVLFVFAAFDVGVGVVYRAHIREFNLES